MATRESIIFDFRRALEQADKIEEIANNLSNLSGQRFEGTMQNLSSNWKGENANLYLQKGEKLQGKMNVTARELRDIASDIRTIAKRLYDAEMAALEIALSREY